MKWAVSPTHRKIWSSGASQAKVPELCSERYMVPASLAASGEGLNSGAPRVEGCHWCLEAGLLERVRTKSPMVLISP